VLALALHIVSSDKMGGAVFSLLSLPPEGEEGGGGGGGGEDILLLWLPVQRRLGLLL